MAEPTLRGGGAREGAEEPVKRSIREWRSPSQTAKTQEGAAKNMLWYVIQTYTGREEKMVEMVRRIIPRPLYGDCFVAYHEQLMKRQNENRVHVERAFPGYAFITADDPESLFFYLKKVPAMSKMIADGEYHFLPLESGEARFLQRILDEDHVARLSYVSTDGRDHIFYTSGPLQSCGSRIVNYHFRKRYAVVRLVLSGEEKNVRLGIVLNDDIRRELSYGKVEAPIAVPETYRVVAPQIESLRRESEFAPGDLVNVVSGAFAGMTAMVCQARKRVLRIRIRLFGQDMTVEVPMDTVQKTVA